MHILFIERKKYMHTERVKTGMVNEDIYMRSILYLKCLVEKYEKECISRRGDSPVKLVDYRIKSAESIAKKLEKKGYSVSYKNAREQLNDLAGIRVVCASVEEVYRLQEFLAKDEGIAIVKEKDYIKQPKTNGYQSLHLIVEMKGLLRIGDKTKGADRPEKIRVEVQMRTEEMHRWAQRDHKLYYKNG